jgi:hypothetical protein
MFIHNPLIQKIHMLFEKLKYLIKRTKTRYLVTYLWMFGLFLIGSLIYFPKKQIESSPLIMLLAAAGMTFVGIGGVIMVIRKESIYSGESNNIVGIIFGVFSALLGFGLAISFIYISIFSKSR